MSLRQLCSLCTFFPRVAERPSHYYLLLFGVELEALSEGTSLGLMVLLAVQVHTLSIRDVLFLRVAKQTAGTSRNKTLSRTLQRCLLLASITSQ